MANHIANDRGETVIASGAPGSIARVQCQYPELIENIAYAQRNGQDVYDVMAKRGIDRTHGITRQSLIEAARIFNKERYLWDENN